MSRRPQPKDSKLQDYARLIDDKVCPDCGVDGCAAIPTLDGSEIHIICMDCNRVFARRVILDGPRWRDLGPFGRI